MSETIYLERLEQRYIVYLKLVAKSRIHVGSTQEGTLKRMVWMNVNGKLLPAIPAESFKGALRKLAAKIAKSIDFQNPEIKEIVAYHTQDRHSRKEKDKLIYPEFIKNANIEDTLKKIFNEEQLKELSYDARNELYLSLKCPVCRLFGSRGLAGKMLLEDVLLIDEPKTNIYTSTSIDRKNKTVASERLFSIESLEPNLRFKCRIIIDNVERESPEAILLARMFEYLLKMGEINIGGAKSRGYGRLAIDKDSIVHLQIFKTPIDEGEILENINILLGKKIETKSLNEFIEWLVYAKS